MNEFSRKRNTAVYKKNNVFASSGFNINFKCVGHA